MYQINIIEDDSEVSESIQLNVDNIQGSELLKSTFDLDQTATSIDIKTGGKITKNSIKVCLDFLRLTDPDKLLNDKSPEILYEIMLSANYMGITQLVDRCSYCVLNIIRQSVFS